MTEEVLPLGGTDCAAPILWATQNGHRFATFQVSTDNET